MLLSEVVLTEKKEDKKKAKPVFIETDVQSPFPDDTLNALKKSVKKEAKDLTKNWKNAIQVVDFAFEDTKVPKPGAFLKQRWDQYLSLIQVAVKALADARGFKGSWRMS
jgi:methionine synthase II (cobalamin-independent)